MAKTSLQKNNDSGTQAKVVVAVAKNLRITPRKLRLAADLVRGLPLEKAYEQLRFSNLKASEITKKLLDSCVANAVHNFKMAPEHLYIKEIFCDGAQVIKRTQARARGSAFVVRHRLSHMTIKLALSSRTFSKLSELKKEHKPASTSGGGDLVSSLPRQVGKKVSAKAQAGTERRKLSKVSAVRRPADGKGEK